MTNPILRIFISKNYNSSYTLNKDIGKIRNSNLTDAVSLSGTGNGVISKEISGEQIIRSAHATGYSYLSIMPQNATGDFLILDNYESSTGKNYKIGLSGEMVKGKIKKIVKFSGDSSNALTPDKIKTYLQQIEKKEIQVQNRTKIILRKALNFLKNK